MAHSSVDVVTVSLTSLDHISISELLGLGTLSSQLSGDGHLGSLGTRLHNESEHTVASTTDGESANKLVLEGLSLSLGTETTVGHALGEEIDTTLLEVESKSLFLRERFNLTLT